jgi:hypothetical protein
MTPENFCYWLQGYFEVQDPTNAGCDDLDHEQVGMIRKHLALVFEHVTAPAVPSSRTLTAEEVRAAEKDGKSLAEALKGYSLIPGGAWTRSFC